ncbi:MAG: hypothetical protein IM638_05090 [Bacteroidetes bacterium]|nr:hypothetical protein [Bacteroidota bacterium]
MLYNQSPEREQINHFRMFVESCKNGEDKYTDLVSNIFKQARALANDKEHIYTIDRGFFTVIHFLSESGKEFLINHKNDNITTADYSRILSILDKQYENNFW